MLLESAFYWLLFCLKFSFKLVTFSKSYARKQKWVFISEHSVYVSIQQNNKRTKISALVLHCLHGWRTRCFAEKIYQVRGMAWIDSETKKNGFQLRRMIEASSRHLAGIIKVVIC